MPTGSPTTAEPGSLALEKAVQTDETRSTYSVNVDDDEAGRTMVSVKTSNRILEPPPSLDPIEAVSATNVISTGPNSAQNDFAPVPSPLSPPPWHFTRRRKGNSGGVIE
uniref:Uncharacterized protein n=1 Tax=Moniliophthora roreri TaxID=221103 RepID=A0A0W0G7I3_MONRR